MQREHRFKTRARHSQRSRRLLRRCFFFFFSYFPLGSQTPTQPTHTRTRKKKIKRKRVPQSKAHPIDAHVALRPAGHCSNRYRSRRPRRNREEAAQRERANRTRQKQKPRVAAAPIVVVVIGYAVISLSVLSQSERGMSRYERGVTNHGARYHEDYM